MKASMRASFDMWSPRTFETWWKGFTAMGDLVRDGLITHEQKVELAQEIQNRVIRPNGTFSVKAYTEYCLGTAEAIRAEYDLEHDEAPAQVDERGLRDGAGAVQSTLEDGS
jgi:hypothetical protein